MNNKLLRNLYQIRKKTPPPKIVIDNSNREYDMNIIDKISKLEKKNSRLINDYNDLLKKSYYSEFQLITRLREKDSIIENLEAKNTKYINFLIYSSLINIIIVIYNFYKL